MSATDDVERKRQWRAANIAKGLTAHGRPRKGVHRPTPAQQEFVTQHSDFKRREPTIPKRNETHEQRRARGAALRGTPMARDIDAAVRKRIKRMDERKPMTKRKTPEFSVDEDTPVDKVLTEALPFGLAFAGRAVVGKTGHATFKARASAEKAATRARKEGLEAVQVLELKDGIILD